MAFEPPATNTPVRLERSSGSFTLRGHATATALITGFAIYIYVLHEWLFQDFSLDARLEPTERERYRRASYYAGEYCRRLSRRFLGGRRQPGFVRELRRFYRLPQGAKIRHIERGAA